MIYGLRLDEPLHRGTCALEAHGAESRVEPRRRFNIPARAHFLGSSFKHAGIGLKGKIYLGRNFMKQKPGNRTTCRYPE